jgi:hypothetical protein
MSSSTTKPGVNQQEWAQAGDKAIDAAVCAGEMASHAASAVGEMASHAVRDVGKRVDDLTARAGVGIQELGNRLSKDTPHAGIIGSASQAVAEAVKDSGEYLEGAKLTGITADIAHVIRRNPIPAVLIAIGFGWFVGRKLKG